MKRNIILICWLTFPLACLANSKVNIHCASAVTGDSCSVKPAQYFIKDYEKTYHNAIINHQCEFSFAIAKPTVAEFIFRNQTVQLFLEPGNDLQCSIAGDSVLKSIAFSGTGAVHNKFLSSFYTTFKNEYDKQLISHSILNSEVESFKLRLNEDLKKQLDFYNNYPEKKSFSESFKRYVENTIRYNYFSRLLSFPIIQANKSWQVETVQVVPPVMLQGIDSKLVNDDALLCEPYRDFLYYYAVYFASEANGFNKFKDGSLSMERKVSMAMKDFSGQSRSWFIASFLNSDLYKVNLETVNHIYRVLTTTDKMGAYSSLLKPVIDARLTMKPAAPVYTDPSSLKTVTNSNCPKLKDIYGDYFTFNDLKGKVIYVDYWASWCGPCKTQMPYSKQLHDMFSEKQLKQIVFLYLSIDESEENWKVAAKRIGLEGKLAISPGDWDSEIVKYFHINSIPRYMLIDKKGNIVDANAKRPASGQEIYNDILKLLE